MNRFLAVCVWSLIGLGAMNEAVAVDQIRVAEESSEASELEMVPMKRVSAQGTGPTLTAGLGAVGLPTLNLQSEFSLGNKTSALVGIQGFVMPSYILGSTSFGVRHYLTGDSHGGLYIEEGIQAGAFVIGMGGEFVGMGPHLGIGGKIERPNGFTVDINIGVSGALALNGLPDVEVFPIPTASLTFGKRLK